MDEQSVLIARIKNSAPFRRSSQMGTLLDFLLKQSTPVAARDIDSVCFGEPARLGSHARQRVLALRKSLADYEAAHPDEKWKIVIPEARGNGGYRAEIVPSIRVDTSLASSFWRPHVLSPKKCRVVCDPVLFFYDHSMPGAFRFVDTNIDSPNDGAALECLKQKHPDAYRDNLIPFHLFIDVGSVRASETLRKYFAKTMSQPISLILSTDCTRKQYLKLSPIFVGTSRTNAFLRGYFRSGDASGLAFRISQETYPAIQILRPTAKEVADLRPLGLKLDKNRDGFLLTPAKDKTLGIVSRVPGPTQNAVMTMIMSDAPFAVAKMAEMLTNEDALRRTFEQMGWSSSRPIPDTLEMLFQVNLWPGDVPDEANEPRLLAWRPRRQP